MKDARQLEDVVHRQVQEIQNLKAERRILKEQLAVYRRFYRHLYDRYLPMKHARHPDSLKSAAHSFWNFVDEQSPRYGEIASDAILHINGSTTSGARTDSEGAAHCRAP